MPTRAESRDATRARVLASSRRLFEERGFNATTIKDIAADAGVSVGSVMYVGDKSGLLVACFDERIEALHTGHPPTSRTQVRSEGGGDGAQAILDILSPFIDLFASSPDLARSYGAVLISGAHSSRVFSELREELINELQDIFAAATDCSTTAAKQRATTAYLAYLGALLEWVSIPGAGTDALCSRVRDAVHPLLTASTEEHNQ
ncbi:DNA-binding transcriptional regulator, AcrR family [Actinomyces ruminicola]|uniref:DNA-binding transcriptional regulator, AcrR family n=1 Tax=Actinomyces ruminicola TaxID=332524 RepID=A0A1G9Z8K0_9ACTO|nr:TetR/AcrR family transcriptional regulator [Actinomyces ruminicola]SDN16916.1 DNA-binding transcriptional regulator, AcrR family [Actinomyces ruminicola]